MAEGEAQGDSQWTCPRMDGCSHDADGQRLAVRATRWLQAPSRQGARLQGGRAHREVSTLHLRVAIAHCVLKRFVWPRAAWRSAQGCLQSSTPPGATRPSHLAAFWNAGHTWKPYSAFDFLLFGKTKNVAQKRLWIRLNELPSLTPLLKCISIATGSSRLCGRTEGYGVGWSIFHDANSAAVLNETFHSVPEITSLSH